MTLNGLQSSANATTKYLAIALLVSACGALLGCDQQSQINDFQHYKFDGPTMGTTYQVQFFAPPGFDLNSLKNQVTLELKRLNEIFSTYEPSSELSRLNQLKSINKKIAVSKELANVLAVAKEIGELSDGSLDVTIGPLVELWGFGAAQKIPLSAIESQLPAVKEFVGDQLFVLEDDGSQVTKKHEKLAIDLSALAKGYAVDAVYHLLKAQRIESLLVEIGGEVKAGGLKSQGDRWRTGLELPDADKRSIGWVIALNDQAVASSGDYRNYFEHDGVRYSHLIDPATARPMPYKNMRVAVVHSKAMVADAWATAFAVLGHVKGLRIAERQNIAVQFALNERVYRSSAFASMVVESY